MNASTWGHHTSPSLLHGLRCVVQQCELVKCVCWNRDETKSRQVNSFPGWVSTITHCFLGWPGVRTPLPWGGPGPQGCTDQCDKMADPPDSGRTPRGLPDVVNRTEGAGAAVDSRDVTSPVSSPVKAWAKAVPPVQSPDTQTASAEDPEEAFEKAMQWARDVSRSACTHPPQFILTPQLDQKRSRNFDFHYDDNSVSMTKNSLEYAVHSLVLIVAVMHEPHLAKELAYGMTLVTKCDEAYTCENATKHGHPAVATYEFFGCCEDA